MTGVSGTKTGTLEGVSPTYEYYSGTGTGGTDLGSTAPSAAGTYTVVASFAGSTDYTSASASQTFTVSKATPTAVLTASANPSVSGQSVVFTATVSGSGSGMPTGTVTFKDGTTILGTGTVNSSGQATFSTSALSGGRHTITASYGGDENFNAANGTLTQTVGLGPTVRITSSASSAVSGQSMTFTATVVASTRGSAKPTGKVTFMDGNTVLGTGTLSASGVATLKTKALGAGSHTITVNYGGDTNFVAGTANLAQKVNQDADHDLACRLSPQGHIWPATDLNRYRQDSNPGVGNAHWNRDLHGRYQEAGHRHPERQRPSDPCYVVGGRGHAQDHGCLRGRHELRLQQRCADRGGPGAPAGPHSARTSTASPDAATLDSAVSGTDNGERPRSSLWNMLAAPAVTDAALAALMRE